MFSRNTHLQATCKLVHCCTLYFAAEASSQVEQVFLDLRHSRSIHNPEASQCIFRQDCAPSEAAAVKSLPILLTWARGATIKVEQTFKTKGELCMNNLASGLTLRCALKSTHSSYSGGACGCVSNRHGWKRHPVQQTVELGVSLAPPTLEPTRI